MENKSKLAPIILFVYDRLQHTKETVEALARNELAKESTLVIFSDGSKDLKNQKAIDQVREYIYWLDAKKWFKEIIRNESPSNKGLAKSIIEGVTAVFERYDKVIVLEDDLVTAPDFLNFMNDALDYYENDPDIGAVSGYSPIKKVNFPAQYNEDVYLTDRHCSTGWATWKPIWNEVDWEVKKYKKFKRDFRARTRFDECGNDRSNRLDKQVKYDLNSWSIRFGFALFSMQKSVIYPTISRLKHIGWDGSGTHSKNGSTNVYLKFNSEIPTKPLVYQLTKPKKNKKITSAIRNVYSGKFAVKLKRLLVHIFYTIGV